ncbi:MAG: cryptochrome/photolyase family protein [Planctomycetota bacterium]
MPSPTDALNCSDVRSAETLLFVFGDCLARDTPGLRSLDKERDAVMLAEVMDEAGPGASSKQRTAFFLSAMRHFALDLIERGYRVRYAKLDARGNTGSFTGELERAVASLKPKRVIVSPPGEHRVAKMVDAWRDVLDVESVEIDEEEHFFTPLEEFDEWADGRKQLILEYFYRDRRKKSGVLMDGKDPIGGEWNFDKENRETFKRAPRVPKRYAPRADDVTDEVLALVRGIDDLPGRLDSFPWGVTPEQARRALDAFIEDCLPSFGTYQDAMWTNEPFLFHSVLSPYFNTRILDPRVAIEKAIDAYESGHAPINSVEGFVRQLIGWREFIRGVYWHEGRDYPERNGLDQHGKLPEFYWSGETEMSCLSHSVNEVLDNGFGHHIQRLMVTGNFALIAGVHPGQVNDWYRAMYADAIDWVTAPNTVGMAMHADHGVVGTKPYAASGKYISRMSNYCEQCCFNVKDRTGEDACPFNTFYWDFLIRNRERFRGNNRMAMILKNVDRMKDDDRAQITLRGRALRDELGIGGISR